MHPYLSQDKTKLYFTSRRYLNQNDIYVTEWDGTDWGIPIRLPSYINLTNSFEQDPCLSSDGLKLYFSSSRMGSYKIFCSEWNGIQWEYPIVVSDHMISGGNSGTPFITQDGSRMYFSNDRTGERKIYYSDFKRVLQCGC